MKRLLGPIFALAVVGVFASASAATATTIDLTADHCTGGCAPPGTIFGTVTLTQNLANVDVTVHLNSPFEFAKTGAADMQAFKFNASGVVLGDITVNQTVPGQTLIADTGAFNGDGTGTFVFGIACSTCGGGLSTAFANNLVFHVANATIADLTAANALGFVFAADIGNPTTGKTGPIGALFQPGPVPQSTVPEPTSLVLVGTGFLAVARKLRRKA